MTETPERANCIAKDEETENIAVMTFVTTPSPWPHVTPVGIFSGNSESRPPSLGGLASRDDILPHELLSF